jgi:hypothetical protein
MSWRCLVLSAEEKLYVILDAGLSPEQKAVQAVHGATQYCLENPGTPWGNGIVVLLQVEDLEAFWQARVRDDLSLGPRALFREPDLEDKLTAVVGLGWKRLTKRLRMMSMVPG